LASALSWSMRPPVAATALRSAVILPSCAIDPVLSSASATRIFTLPHAVVEVMVKFIVLKLVLSTFMKSVVTDPFTVSWTVLPILPLFGV
jgi:hypothetical protein